MSNLRKRRGFSLLELMIVVIIMLAVAAIAIPSFTTYISTYRLRGAMTDVAGMLQQMRMEAVKRNTTLAVSTDTAGTMAWVNLPTAAGTSNWDAGEPFVLLPRNISAQSSGYPGSNTLETSLGYTKQDITSSSPLRFNTRGLPCVIDTSVSPICENYNVSTSQQVGYVLYFRNDGAYGVPGWGAITITPAGRIRTWLWNGSSYSGQ